MNPKCSTKLVQIFVCPAVNGQLFYKNADCAELVMKPDIKFVEEIIIDSKSKN